MNKRKMQIHLFVNLQKEKGGAQEIFFSAPKISLNMEGIDDEAISSGEIVYSVLLQFSDTKPSIVGLLSTYSPTCSTSGSLLQADSPS